MFVTVRLGANTQPVASTTKFWNEGAVMTMANSCNKTENELTRFMGASGSKQGLNNTCIVREAHPVFQSPLKPGNASKKRES